MKSARETSSGQRRLPVSLESRCSRKGISGGAGERSSRHAGKAVENGRSRVKERSLSPWRNHQPAREARFSKHPFRGRAPGPWRRNPERRSPLRRFSPLRHKTSPINELDLERPAMKIGDQFHEDRGNFNTKFGQRSHFPSVIGAGCEFERVDSTGRALQKNFNRRVRSPQRFVSGGQLPEPVRYIGGGGLAQLPFIKGPTLAPDRNPLLVEKNCAEKKESSEAERPVMRLVDPCTVPTTGTFFSHDDRTEVVRRYGDYWERRFRRRRQMRAPLPSEGIWKHDLFEDISSSDADVCHEEPVATEKLDGAP